MRRGSNINMLDHYRINYLNSWKKLIRSPMELPFPVLIDIATLFLLVFFIDMYALMIGGPIQQALVDLANPKIDGIFGPIANILLLTLVFYFAIYLVWTVLQTLSFNHALNLSGNKVKYSEQLKRNALHNLLWIGILFIINSGQDILLFINTMVKKMLFNQDFLFYLGYFMILILLYFASIGYINYSPKLGIKKAKVIIPVFLMIIVTFIGIDLILKLLFMLHGSPAVNLISGLVLLFPAITWARLFLITSIKGESHEKEC
jgi:hypothetical protein